MVTYRKPNMSKINSQMRKLKSATNQFERDTNRAINELKSIERKAKSYQNKLRLSSIPSLTTMPSLYLGPSHDDEVEAFLYDDYTTGWLRIVGIAVGFCAARAFLLYRNLQVYFHEIEL